MAPLFQWTPRDNSASVGTIAELIQRPAQIRADAERRAAAAQAQATLQRGQIRGEMFGSLGQLASGVVQQYGQQQEQAKRGELLTQALDGLVSGKATLEQIMPALGAEDTQALVKAVQGYDDLMNGRTDRAREAVKNILPVIQPMAPEARQRYWTMPGGLREATIRGGLLTEQNAPPELTDEMLGEVGRWVTAPEDAPKPVQVDTVDEQGNPVTRFETPTPGASYPKYQAPAKPPAPPAVGSFEDYVVRRFGENPTPQQIEQARRGYGEAGRAPSVTIQNREAGDEEIKAAARNIVANPRDLVSIRNITSLRGDQRMKLFNEIKRLDPAFNVGMIDRQIKFLDSYEDPKGRAKLNRDSMNNILQHAGDLSEVNQKYRRTNLRITNTPINKLAEQHSDVFTEYSTTLAVLTDEIGLYFAGGYAPQGEQIETWKRVLAGNATPAQVEQFAKTIVHVGLRRADTHNQGFRAVMGYDDPNLLTPQAVEAGRKLGLGDAVSRYGSGGQLGRAPGAAPSQPRAFSVKAPDGRTYTFPTQAQLDAFKRRARIQ